ncbi:MAG: hypothetical protein RPU34_04335 [Candidatus Sedimenticola sp. (ex Thyasira tokunagai)]
MTELNEATRPESRAGVAIPDKRMVSAPPLLRSYKVWHISHPEWARTYVASSPGKAKRQMHVELEEIDYHYCDLRCSVMPGFVTDSEFLRTAEYRGVPFARIGMRVKVGGDPGMIVGKNSSANFNILFDDGDHPLNCHPNWDIKYLDDDGTVLAEYPGR